MGMVPAYRKDTGEKVYVPEHWLDHRTLGKPFRKTPKTPPAPRGPVVTEKAPAASGGDTNTPKEK